MNELEAEALGARLTRIWKPQSFEMDFGNGEDGFAGFNYYPMLDKEVRLEVTGNGSGDITPLPYFHYFQKVTTVTGVFVA